MGIVIQGPWKAPGTNKKFIDIRRIIDHELEIVDRLAAQIKDDTREQPQPSGTSKKHLAADKT
jgi:hypothetical protein